MKEVRKKLSNEHVICRKRGTHLLSRYPTCDIGYLYSKVHMGTLIRQTYGTQSPFPSMTFSVILINTNMSGNHVLVL